MIPTYNPSYSQRFINKRSINMKLLPSAG